MVAAGVQYAAVFTTVVIVVAALAIRGLGSLTLDSRGWSHRLFLLASIPGL